MIRISASALAIVSAWTVSAHAQWLTHPTSGIPRTADGRPDLSAPAPVTADGRPALSGLWIPDPGASGRTGIRAAERSPYFLDITADMKPEDVPFQPWAEADYRRRVEGQSKDDPTAQCQPTGIPGLNTYPQPFKILQLPALMVILYENDTDFRQIFLDGRAHPDDPQPTWMGYSVGRWDAGTLVVETIGFAGRSWLDRTGHPRTEAMRVTERFRRLDFGRMEIEITIDDRALFVDAERATRFLRFIVDLTLDGRASEIKESVIAIEVLGRTASFDSKTDPIVRVEAGRLRERLREYYDQAGNADDVLISVPKGGYVPEFAEREPLTQQQNPLRLSVLPPDGADVESFVVSPDGRQIAFAGRVNGRPMLRATLS